MRFFAVFAVASFQAALLQPAAPPKHLKLAASASVATAAPGATVSLFVDITPDPGIHLYAPGAKDYLPIALKIDPKPGISAGPLAYPKSQTMVFEGQKIPVYDKPFRLTQPLTIDRSAGSGGTIIVSGTLKYQACNDEVCFIPADARVTWKIAVSGAAAPRAEFPTTRPAS